jgi:hypothetical protein
MIEKHTLRSLSNEEESSIARAWDLSPECAELQEKQKNLKEKIGQKSGIYSNRC